MHTGAYFDPGMEFNLPEDLESHSRESLEQIFDSAFSGTGIRIIKSHMFSIHLDFIRRTWPDCPIVLVHRDDDACLGWWVKCGHFDITYPLYNKYYVNLKTMAGIIRDQNQNIVAAAMKYTGRNPITNNQLCTALGITQPPANYFQDYGQSDVRVTVI
jgi:hypothetical protein